MTRAPIRGLLLAVVSLLVHLPLVVLSLVAVVLIPLGAGVFALPVVTAAVRRAANRHRPAGATPYAPEPDGPTGGWQRCRWLLTDPATWRDLLWLLLSVPAGLVAGLPGALALYGLEGVLLVPLLFLSVVGSFGYGFVWPIEHAWQAWLAVPQGALFLLAGLWLAPRAVRLYDRTARWLLAPTRSARLAQRVRQLTESRGAAVDAQAAELRRIERDLHDGAQARLVALSMALGLAEELMARDPAAARELVVEAREASGRALVELRDLVRGIHPPVLAERGLDGAVRALALAVPMPVDIAMDLSGRAEAPVESAAYFAVAEALANVTKHSRAGRAWIRLSHRDGRLGLVVGDDGRGGADPGAGTGLRGIERRLAAFDGTMIVTSPPGGPTVVTMELPCELSSPRTSPSSGTD